MTNRKNALASSYIVFLFYIPKSCESKILYKSIHTNIKQHHFPCKFSKKTTLLCQPLPKDPFWSIKKCFAHFCPHHFPALSPQSKKNAPSSLEISPLRKCTIDLYLFNRTDKNHYPRWGRNPSTLMIGETKGSYET